MRSVGLGLASLICLACAIAVWLLAEGVVRGATGSAVTAALGATMTVGALVAAVAMLALKARR